MERLPLGADEPEHADLAHWQRNVGASLALDLAPAPTQRVTGATVVCWNVGIGSGDVERLHAHLLAEGLADDAARPLVLLLQEAFRTDDTVPELPFTPHHGGKAGIAGRHDIVAAARSLGMSLRYAPSMRNGASRSDRGNAVLSAAPLAEAWTLQLPHVRQRRVAVAVPLRDVPDLLFASAHLDTRGRPAGSRRLVRFGAGRVVQAAALAARLTWSHEQRTLVLGADLNTYLGDRDPALEALRMAGFDPLARDGRWTNTFAGPVRMLLDHVLIRAGTQAVTAAPLVRLDDGRPDRRVFGSDHYPLLTRLDFRA